MEAIIIAVVFFVVWKLWVKFRPAHLAPDPKEAPRYGGAPYLPPEEDGDGTVSPPGDKERAK